MGKHGLTRVSYDGDKCVIVSGPVPDHVAQDAVEQTPIGDQPGKLAKPPKPAPPKFVAPAPAVKEKK